VTVIAVVIPYYQKSSGILRRALSSVLQQRLPPDAVVHVIVTDDGSPVPASAEAEVLSFAAPYHLTIIKQPNTGISAARNTALCHAPEGTTYVALLDSDDLWEPNHLARAISALDHGSDYYFCDSERGGVTKFAENDFNPFLYKHGQSLGDSIYAMDCKPFFDRSLRAPPFHTSTSVFRHAVARSMLFDISLRVAGEDHLFLFELIQKSRRICCSSELLVKCGEGLNIYSSKYSWEDSGHLLRQMGLILAFYKYRERLSLSAMNDGFLANRLRILRAAFAFFTVRYFVRIRKPWPQELRDMVHSDRRFKLWYPLYVLYVAVCFPLRLYDPLKKW
jgi:succinoglycan biosynthesis protein ExoW